MKYAHEIQLRVLLKPQLDLVDDDEHWRGDIGANFTDKSWV